MKFNKFLLIISLIPALASVAIAGIAGYTDNGKKFFSKGHPKSFGYNVEIKYPSNWIATEGIRPHVVQNFKNGKGSICTLIINKIVSEPFSPVEWEDVAKEDFGEDWKNFMTSAFPNGKIIGDMDIVHTKYDGNPGVLAEFEVMNTQRAGLNIYTYNVHHMFFYKDSLFSLQCATGGFSEKNIKEQIPQVYALFRLMGNDIVLHDRYNSSPVSTARNNSNNTASKIGWIIGLCIIFIYDFFKKKSKSS